MTTSEETKCESCGATVTPVDGKCPKCGAEIKAGSGGKRTVQLQGYTLTVEDDDLASKAKHAVPGRPKK